MVPTVLINHLRWWLISTKLSIEIIQHDPSKRSKEIGDQLPESPSFLGNFSVRWINESIRQMERNFFFFFLWKYKPSPLRCCGGWSCRLRENLFFLKQNFHKNCFFSSFFSCDKRKEIKNSWNLRKDIFELPWRGGTSIGKDRFQVSGPLLLLPVLAAISFNWNIGLLRFATPALRVRKILQGRGNLI